MKNTKYKSFIKLIRSGKYEPVSLKVILSCELFLDGLTAREYTKLNELIDYLNDDEPLTLKCVATQFIGKPYKV